MRFYELIRNEIKKIIEVYQLDDYLLQRICWMIDHALCIKYTYFPKLKDLTDNKESFRSTYERIASIPSFYGSSETADFIKFLIEITKAIKQDKEDAAKQEKLKRLKELKEEISKLEQEIYGN